MQRLSLNSIASFASIANWRLRAILLGQFWLPVVVLAQHEISGDKIEKSMPENGYVMRCIPGEELVFRNIGNHRGEVSKLISEKGAAYLSVDLYDLNSPKAFECSVNEKLISVVLSGKKIGVDELIDKYGIFHDRCDRSINFFSLKIDQKIVMDEVRVSGDDCDQDIVYVVYFKMIRRGSNVVLEIRDIKGLVREINFQ